MPSANKGKKKVVRINPKMQAIVDGTLDISELDDEEIRRGQFRSAQGTFQGRPTDMVPRKFHEALVRETIKRANLRMREELIPAINTLKEISENKRAPADARYKSAVYLIERVAGKVPEKSEVKVEVAKWEADIEGLLYEGDKDA